MKIDEKKQTVGGYLFYTERDAQLARAEEQKIQYLETHIDYHSPESIKYIYEKTIHDRLFKTPVGLQYLKHLQEFLLEQSQLDTDGIGAIPLYTAFDVELRDETSPARQRVRPSKKQDAEKGKAAFFISVFSNVLLVIAIIAMFAISFNSEQPNIFNYERALVDKYAAWDQELTEREQTIREKEIEYHINR